MDAADDAACGGDVLEGVVVAPIASSGAGRVNRDELFFFSSRRRHTRWTGDWSSDVCSSDLGGADLFTYDAAQGASSFALNPGATAAGLAPVDASGKANGSALKLAALANAPDAIDGSSLDRKSVV